MSSDTATRRNQGNAWPPELIPLRRAATLAYQCVYPRVAAADQAGWRVVAQAVCDLAPVYAYDERKARSRLISSFDLAGSIVAEDGSSLRFTDKRPDLANVAVRAEDLRKVIRTLIESGISFAEIAAHHRA